MESFVMGKQNQAPRPAAPRSSGAPRVDPATLQKIKIVAQLDQVPAPMRQMSHAKVRAGRG